MLSIRKLMIQFIRIARMISCRPETQQWWETPESGEA